VTSLLKSLKTKASFPQTQQSACESRSDLFTSSTRPTDTNCIFKAERFAFQLLPRFFFLLWRVKAALERLEVPYSSSEYSSSSILVLSAAMERVRDLSVAPFPLFLPLLLSVPVWIFPTWPLEALEP
jgi:hypothetical protein